jgi:hypothetical protein
MVGLSNGAAYTTPVKLGKIVSAGRDFQPIPSAETVNTGGVGE